MSDRAYNEQSFDSLFARFGSERAKLLGVLAPLTPEQWQRAATVSVAGKPYERSVHFYADWLARHERSHVRHIERFAKTLQNA